MCVTLKTNRDGVVVIVIRLWAAKQRNHGSIPGRRKKERIFFLLQIVQRPNESPMHFVFTDTPRQNLNNCDSVTLLLLFFWQTAVFRIALMEFGSNFANNYGGPRPVVYTTAGTHAHTD
jgi:hypothetical protein